MIMIFQIDGSRKAMTARIRKKVGKAEHDIDEAHEGGIDPSAVIAGHRTEHDADHCGDADGDEPDQKTIRAP